MNQPQSPIKASNNYAAPNTPIASSKQVKKTVKPVTSINSPIAKKTEGLAAAGR